MTLWTPANLTVSPALWFDASDAASITASAGAVSQWNDKSGNGLNATQSTFVKQPANNAATLNALTVITFGFSSTEKKLVHPSVLSSDFTAIYLCNPTDVTSLQVNCIHGGDVTNGAIEFTAATKFSTGGMGAFTNSNSRLESAAPVTGWQILGFTPSHLWRNGAEPAYKSGAADVPGGAITTIGSRSDVATLYFIGHIAEIVVCPSTISTGLRQLIEGYLAWKWGQTALLPAGHPYKSAAPTISSGALAVTEAADTIAAAGLAPARGTLSVTADNDTGSATGVTPIHGTAAITDAGDTDTATGVGPDHGAAAITEAGDTDTATGAVPGHGAATITEAGDTVTGTGTVSTPIHGASTTTEAGDTATGTIVTSIRGTLNETEIDDGIVLAVADASTLPRIWPFAPNWSSTVQTTLEFKTDIIVSRSGSEQRRALRTVPRRSVEYSILANDADMRRMWRLLSVWQNRQFLVGDPTRAIALTGAVTAGAAVLPVGEAADWLVAGAVVMLESGNSRVTATVQSVTADTVTLTAPLAAAWPMPTTIMPMLTGLIGTSVTGQNQTNQLLTLSVTLAVDPGSETFPATAASADCYDGREVLLRRPNWASQVSAGFMWDFEQIDFGYGRIDTTYPIVAPTATRSASVLLNGRDEVSEIEQFFVRQLGRQGEFLAPTWTDDIPLGELAAAGTAVIRTPGTDLYADFTDHPVYQAIAILMADGRAVFRKIVGITTDGTDSLLECDQAFFFDIDPAQVAMISWMPVVRFGADTWTTTWQTDRVAQATLAVQTLPYLAAENPVTAYDSAAQYAYETWGADSLATMDQFDHEVNVHYPEVMA